MAMKEIPTLVAENYFLRGMTMEDVPQLFPFMSDAKTMKFITPHPVKTVQQLEEKINNYLINYQKEKEIPWVIIHKEDNDLVGMFRFHKLNYWHRKAEMGAVIREDYQRKGVMSEILLELLIYGFHTLNLNRIVGDTFEENQGSRKLLMKFGFRKEGQFRETDFDGQKYHDTIVYSLLKREFEELVSKGGWN